MLYWLRRRIGFDGADDPIGETTAELISKEFSSIYFKQLAIVFNGLLSNVSSLMDPIVMYVDLTYFRHALMIEMEKA